LSVYAFFCGVSERNLHVVGHFEAEEIHISMINFLDLLSTAKEVYDNYKSIHELLVDETARIINAIGERELNSALKTLDDIRYSKNVQREFSSVITQLRLALEKISSKTTKKSKVALLIALCYKFIGEYQLSSQFGARSITFFNDWIEAEKKRIFTPAKGYLREAVLSQVKDDLDEMGIIHKDKLPNKSFFDSLWNGDDTSNRAEKVVVESKNYYATYVNRILSF